MELAFDAEEMGAAPSASCGGNHTRRRHTQVLGHTQQVEHHATAMPERAHGRQRRAESIRREEEDAAAREGGARAE